MKKVYGLFVTFENEVHITRNRLSVGPVTLLTRAGGIVGVGKNLLWIVITFFTFMMTLKSCIKT